MAADEINAAGGINGRQVQIITEDDQGEPDKAATVVTKLINQDKVQAVIGEVASSNSLAAAPNAQEAKVPMISPSSTNPKVTQVGDYIFRVCFIDPFQGEVMAKFAANSLKAKKAAILLRLQFGLQQGLVQFFKASFTKLGGEIVTEKAYTQRDRDFTGQLTAIRSETGCDLRARLLQEVGVIAKQTKQLGIKAPLLGGDGWDSPQLWELGGDSLNGSYISNHYSVDDPSPAIQDFVSGLQSEIQHRARRARRTRLRRHDGAGRLNQARGNYRVRGAARRDRRNQRLQGITGMITIDEERNAVKSAVVLKLQDQKFVYENTISPEGTATPGAASGAYSRCISPAKAASPTN